MFTPYVGCSSLSDAMRFLSVFVVVVGLVVAVAVADVTD